MTFGQVANEEDGGDKAGEHVESFLDDDEDQENDAGAADHGEEE